MDDSLKKIEVAAFDAARIKAIDNYALLEAMLASILSDVLDVNISKALIIFYRVVNTRSRMGIISDLLAKSPHAETRPFWRSVEKEIVRIDGVRNQIIHWISVYDHGSIGGPDTPQPKITLRPGQLTDNELTLADLTKFTNDVQALVRELTYYGIYLTSQKFSPDERAALQQIFQRPRDDQTRPALETVLFSKARRPPPQSSGA